MRKFYAQIWKSVIRSNVFVTESFVTTKGNKTQVGKPVLRGGKIINKFIDPLRGSDVSA
jgi:hypothetical protein